MKLAFLLWLASVLPQPAADHVCMAGTIYLEARSEPLAGQLAVAEVALRRVDSGQWGNSAYAVLTALDNLLYPQRRKIIICKKWIPCVAPGPLRTSP